VFERNKSFLFSRELIVEKCRFCDRIENYYHYIHFYIQRVDMNKKNHKKLLVGSVLITLSFLPGCALFDMFKSNNEQIVIEDRDLVVPMTGEVLVTMKGIPVITTDTLAVEKEKVLKAHPQIRQALTVMDPKPFERDLLEGLITQEIAAEYVRSQGIDQTDTYKKELKELYEAMENILNARYFNEMAKITVSDAEVRDFYEAQKDKYPGIKISQGGIMAIGIDFDNGAAARAFAARVKTTPGGFKKVAQDDNINAQIKDFKLVNERSLGVDELLRDKIVGIKTIPSVEVFDVNGKFWVINVTAKEEPKYIAYEQAKDRLRQEVEQGKRVELLKKEMDNLRKQYAVEVNEDYFKGAEQAQQEMSVPEQRGGIAHAADKKETIDKRLA
jgi:hypothetical protein